MVAGDLTAGWRVLLLEAWPMHFPGLFLCYPQRQMAPALRIFIDAVREAAQTTEQGGRLVLG